MEKSLFSVQKGLPDDGVWKIFLCGAGVVPALYTIHQLRLPEFYARGDL